MAGQIPSVPGAVATKLLSHTDAASATVDLAGNPL